MDDSGRDTREQRDAKEWHDPSGEDLQLYLDESWVAINDLRKVEARVRRIRTITVVALVLLCIAILVFLALRYVEFRDPIKASGTGVVAWLAVTEAQSADLKLFPLESGESTDAGKRGVDLAPVQALSVGDELSVAAGAEAVLFISEGDIRQEYAGRCNLTIRPAGPEITGGDGQLINTVAITEWLRALTPLDQPPPEDEVAATHDQPQLHYPVDCNCYTGTISLEWGYSGSVENLVVKVYTRGGELVRETEIEAGMGSLALTLEASRGYRWDVTAGGVVSAAGEFRVLGDVERDWISTAAQACGLDGVDITAEATAGNSLYRLAVLYSILVEHDLPREADAVLLRLKSVVGVE